MATVLVYRSQSASFACQRVAATAPSQLRAVQEDEYHHQDGDAAVVRWDCYADLSLGSGVLDVNPATAVRLSRDKGASRRLLAELTAPTWQTLSDVQVPCVVRPRRHKAGARFYICRTMADVRLAIRRCGTGWYASALIDKAREFRVFVVGGRVAAVSERFPGEDSEGVGAVAWNLSLGGRLVNVNRPDWPVPALQASIEAARRLGLGWAAVDVALDRDGRPVVWELNTAPALRNKWTIGQLAKALASPFVEGPIKEGARKPRSYAHPGVLRDREPVPPEPDVIVSRPQAPQVEATIEQPPVAITELPPEPTSQRSAGQILDDFFTSLPEGYAMPLNLDRNSIAEFRVLADPSISTIGRAIDRAHELRASHFQFNGYIYDATTLQAVYRPAA